MALRAAVASGNWSNPAIWNGGVLPNPGDIVASNTFTVTIDQNITVDVLTNTAQTKNTIVPFMTSNTTPSGIASSNVGVAWQAFDNSSSYWLVQTAQVGDYVQYQFPTARAVDQYNFSNGTSFNGSVSLQGSHDGINFTTLHTASVVLTGNGTYESPLIGNSTLYLYYRFVLNSAIYVQITFVRFFEYLGTSPAVAGGGFILNNGVTVTCTNTGNGISIGATTLLTYSGTGSVVINGNIGGITANSITGFLISGAGNVTINGTINGSTSNSSTTTINVTAAAILNVNGNVNGFSGSAGNANAIRMNTSGGILNLVGNIELRGTIKQVVSMLAGTTLNMTGDILCQLSSANSGVGVDANAATINITGNLSITNATNINNVNWYCLGASNICTINIIGTISNDLTSNAMTFSYPVNIFGSSYFNHIGSVIGGLRAPAIYNLVAGAINIMTGPFISSPSGIQPFYVTRMHYRRTLGSYYEFRDNSTNGALPPAGPAPITRLVSPGTAIDAPAASNVRQGVVYAAGSLTGTMVVPAASNVANNVPVDNTLGTAVLDPNAIWAVPLTSINTLNSIGRRVKNAATVETTGAQIQTTLNNNE
jgi:hypothetical protein